MLHRLIVSIFLFFAISNSIVAQKLFDNLESSDRFYYLFNFSFEQFKAGGQIKEFSETLYDSIYNDKYFYMETAEVISNDSNSFNLIFCRVYPDLSTHYDYWYRNVFPVLITHHDSVFIRGDSFTNFDSYKRELKEYLLNPLDKEYLPEKYVDSIPFFGEVLVTKQFIVFNTQMPFDSLGNRTSFEKLFEMVLPTIESINEIRNETSLNKWNKSYSELEIAKKSAVNELFPLRIRIILDYKVPPPPPPPPAPYNFDKIENSFDSLMQEKIKNN